MRAYSCQLPAYLFFCTLKVFVDVSGEKYSVCQDWNFVAHVNQMMLTTAQIHLELHNILRRTAHQEKFQA